MPECEENERFIGVMHDGRETIYNKNNALLERKWCDGGDIILGIRQMRVIRILSTKSTKNCPHLGTQ